MLINALLEKILITDINFLERFWKALRFIICMKEGETKILLLKVEIKKDEKSEDDPYDIFLSEEEKDKDPGEFILSSFLTRNIPKIKCMCFQYIFQIFKHVVKQKDNKDIPRLKYHIILKEFYNNCFDIKSIDTFGVVYERNLELIKKYDTIFNGY